MPLDPRCDQGHYLLAINENKGSLGKLRLPRRRPSFHEARDRLCASRCRECADASMQMKAKLLCDRLWICPEPVRHAPFSHQGFIDFRHLTAKGIPPHLNGAVARCRHPGRRRWIRERDTKRPPRKFVPLLKPRCSFQPQQLILGLLRNSNRFYDHRLPFPEKALRIELAEASPSKSKT